MQKFRRRHLLGAALVLPLAAAFLPRTNLLAAPEDNVIASEWVHEGTELHKGTLDHISMDGSAIVAGASGGTYTSPGFTMKTSFQTLTAVWKGSPGITAEVRTQQSAKETWGAWIPLTVGEEVHARDEADLQVSNLISVPASHIVQYRLKMPAGSRFTQMRITGMDTSQGPSSKDAQLKKVDALTAPGAPQIISRAGWGANERYRYTRAGELIWPYEYRKPYKIILHHTVTQNNEPNPMATLRSVYYYHAVTLGWGDIGYNYLIDWKGNIYEGRAGGPNVVGGHALKYNYGSVGIAVLGTYTQTPISKESFDAVVRLISWLLGSLPIDPLGKSWFIDHTTANICGHRDAMPGQTICPGDGFYAQLPSVRESVSTQAAPLPISLTPSDNSWVGGKQVVIHASANGSVTRTDLLLNNSPRASSNTGTLEYTLDTTTLPQGSTQVIKAVATDANGQQQAVTSTLRVDNRAPGWSNWTYGPGTRTATINANDPDSGISASSAQFRLLDNGIWTDWQEVPGRRGTPNATTLVVPYIRGSATAIQFQVSDAAGNQVDSANYKLEGMVAVDNHFQSYYKTFDGTRLLGNALTVARIQNGVWVQYFEKGRLEDRSQETTNPDWKIQYGLLVDELHATQALVPIGGDTSTLTYEILNKLADASNQVKPPPGYPGKGTYTMNNDGTTFVPFTADLRGANGHMVLGGFWQYINRKGLFPGGWLHDVGLPIMEAIPATVTKYFPTGPVKRKILIQAFQRTILTYDPANPPDWQIERANVGTDYVKIFEIQ